MAQENPVSAEYIIMEKVPGIKLERVWPSMKIADRFTLVKAIASFQKAWTLVSFKKFGSLYYAKDLGEGAGNEPLYIDANGVDITDAKFAIGPSTGRELIDNRRATVDFDRGPCKISKLGLRIRWLMNTREDFRGADQVPPPHRSIYYIITSLAWRPPRC